MIRQEQTPEEIAENPSVKADSTPFQEEADLQFALQIAELGWWNWDLPTETVRHSQAFRQMIGGPACDRLPDYDTFLRYVHPDDCEKMREVLNSGMLGTLNPETLTNGYEFRVVWPDGSIHWVETRGRLIYDEAGQPLRIVGVCMNIDRRKQEKELFRTLCEVSPLGIFLQDTEGRCLYTNARWQEIAGLTHDEGAGYGWTRAIHPEDLERGFVEWNASLQSGREYQSEMRFVQPSGEIRWGRIRTRAIPTVDGTVSGYVGTLEDITERKHIQEHLLQAQKLESLGRLAGGVAHDFNNLLTAILGYTEMALEELPPHSLLGDYLENVRTAGERAASLTAHLLAFARKQIIAPRVFSLADLLHETERILRPLLGVSVLLKIVISPEAGLVKADPGQIQQVLLNLAVNARDAMPEGGTLTLEVGTATLDVESARQDEGVPPGEYVTLTVRDTGRGMEEYVREHLFEPFFTTKGIGEGTGLGLATCHGIVRQNEGYIAVQSEPGVGSTFVVYLPRVWEPCTAVIASTQETRLRGSETILLVEDEEMVREFTLQALTTRGYTVLSAADGTEALRIAQETAGKIWLLVTDIMMPQMNGGALAERFLRLHPEAKVLFVSGYADASSGQQMVQEMSADFLPKPYTPGALAARVREILDR